MIHGDIMSLDEQDNIEIIAEKEDSIYLIMVESRKWEDINYTKTKVIAKIHNFKEYAKSKEAKKKYKNKRIKIVLESKYEPPQNIKNLLKRERVKLEVQ